MHYLREMDEGLERHISQQSIKEENIKRLFNLLNGSRELSRSDLVRRTGLSATTVSALVEELIQERLAVEVGYAYTKQTGRKPINLRINASSRQIPVITLWRRGVLFTLYNLQMEVLEKIVVHHSADCYGSFSGDENRKYADASEDYTALIEDILLRQSKKFRRKDALTLCINYPGIYIAERKCFYLSSMRIVLRQKSLEDMEARLGLPVFMGKVAQSMGYAEKKQRELQGQDVDELIYVAVRNGVGTGIISDGRILTGKHHFSGEIGHVSIDYRGRPCICGGRGCLEQYVNLEEIISRVAQVVDFHPNDMLPSRGEELNLQMIGRAYDAGKPEIVGVLDDVAERLFAAIYSAMCMTGVRRVYIGGGIEQLGVGFINKMKELMRRAAAGMLTQHLSIEYGCIGFEDVGRGIAEYYIDHVFEISGQK